MSRKMKVWNSEALSETYVTLAQIKANIEELIKSSSVPLEHLPSSIVPTDTLYMIAICYELMYDAMLDEHLIKSGNTKQKIQNIN